MRRNVIAAAAAALLLMSCNFFRTVEEINNPDWESQVTSISLDRTSLSVDGGSADVLTLKIEPESVRTKVSPVWTCAFMDGAEECFEIDGNSSNCTVKGRRVGKGYLKCTLNNMTATCLIDVASNDPELYVTEYYIYSADPGVIELTPDSYKNISVTLYNGSSEDHENFTWEVTDGSIATISSARNNCTVTARAVGSTQIKVRNPKAEYEYTFVVYVYNDLTKGMPYITTKTNVLTINTASSSTRTVEFSIANDQSNGASATRYSYEDTTSSGAGSVVTVTNSNSNTLQVSAVPNRSGQAEITVRNDYCEYPLRIIVVVSNIVQNVYVTTSESTLQISDDGIHAIYAYLNGYDGAADEDGFTWSIEAVRSSMPTYSPDVDGSGNDTGWKRYLDFVCSGSTCQIQGKKNGVFRIRAGHSRAAAQRTVVVILTNQKGSAVDASMFITTSQNYVQTKVDGEATEITVTLVGGEEGDQNDFVWTLSSDDGDPMKMLSCTSLSSGTVRSRSALTAGTDAYGRVMIVPNQTEDEQGIKAPYGGQDGLTGTVKIEISHPKCLYTAEVVVKIFSKWALIAPEVKVDIQSEEDGKWASVSLVKALYSKLDNVGIELRAALENSTDYGKVSWNAEGGSPLVEPDTASGETTRIRRKDGATAAGTTYISASHEDALAARRVLFLTAATEEELNSLKGLYAENTCHRITEDPDDKANHTATLALKSFGFAEGEKFAVNYSAADSNVVSLKNTLAEYTAGATGEAAVTMEVTGLKAGRTTVTASLKDYPSAAGVVFDIFVMEKGESIGANEVKYLTTRQNAVVIPQVNQSAELEVIGQGISELQMGETRWSFKASEAEDIVDGIKGHKGAKATITAMKTGKTVVNAANDDSVNSLDINVKVGDIYEYEDNYFCYITSEQDTYMLVKGEEITIGASLVNSSAGGDGWAWSAASLDGGSQSNIAAVSLSSDGTSAACRVTALEAGQAYLRVSHPLAAAEKEILVVVGNSAEELNGLAYLTTNQNVVTVGEQSNATVQIQVQNAPKQIVSGYIWSSSDPETVSVVGSGTTAVFYGNKTGTAVITVANYDSGIIYPLEIIANCVDPVAAAENPYIACENIVTVSIGDSPYTLTAELVGGAASDNINFMWSVVNNDPKITINSSNETCQITGNAAGVAQIRIRHPKALGADRTVLVIVNNQAVADCVITTSDSLIQTLAPDGNSVNLTVSLDNGTAADNHSFRWWADNYTAASLTANENTCIVTPKAPGFVNVTVSHPRAKHEKVFSIQVTAATTFGFDYSADVITMTEGNSQIVYMKVPILDVDSQYVDYRSMDTSIADFGLTSSTMCNLRALKKGQTTIEAVLYGTKNGQKLEYGRATKYVYVNEAESGARYVKLTSGADVNIMSYDRMDYNKTDTLVLRAEPYSDDPDALAAMRSRKSSSGLRWSITNVSGEKSLFSCVPPSLEGDTLSLTPVATGTARLTISMPDSVEKDVEPKSVFLVVNGADSLTISIQKSLELQEQGGSEMVTASLSGGDASAYKRIMWNMYEDPEGTKRHTSGSVASFTGAGATVNVTADQVGTVYLVASVTSLNPENTSEEIVVKDTCKITVVEKPAVQFDYDDMIMMPETEYMVGYRVKPSDDELMFPVLSSDSAVARVVEDKCEYDPETGRGKLCILTGTKPKIQDERVVLTATTKNRRVQGCLTASVGYNCLFSLDKALVASTPDKTSKSACDKNGSPLVFEYKVRPANSEIVLQWPVTDAYFGSKNLALYKTEGCTVSGPEYSGTNIVYRLRPNQSLASKQTDIVGGKIMFYTKGEVNTALTTSGVSQHVVCTVLNMENEGKQTARTTIDVKSFSPTHTVKMSGSLSGSIKHSAWDSKLNAIVIGDGESVKFSLTADEGAIELDTYRTCFTRNTGERGAQDTGDKTLRNFSGSKEQQGYRIHFEMDSAKRITLSHNLDYGWDTNPKNADAQTAKTTSSPGSVYNQAALLGVHLADTDTDLLSASKDTTVRYTDLAGTLDAWYFDYATGESKKFSIKVYVECRNSRCR